MGYVDVPTIMTVLKWLGIVLLYAAIIAIIVAAFRYFAHTIDLDYLFNIDGMCDGCKPLAYSWLVVSLVFVITLTIYLLEPYHPHYFRISGILALISGIATSLYMVMLGIDAAAYA